MQTAVRCHLTQTWKGSVGEDVGNRSPRALPMGTHTVQPLWEAVVPQGVKRSQHVTQRFHSQLYAPQQETCAHTFPRMFTAVPFTKAKEGDIQMSTD